MKTHLQILIWRLLGQIYHTEEHGPSRSLESRLECHIGASLSPGYKPSQCDLVNCALDHNTILSYIVALFKSETQAQFYENTEGVLWENHNFRNSQRRKRPKKVEKGKSTNKVNLKLC